MTPDQQIAQKTWPTYRIAGSGTIAVVKHCGGIVELCADDISARIVCAEQCVRYCNMHHEIRHRKPAKQPVVLDRTGYSE
jgi:hypothetical protein